MLAPLIVSVPSPSLLTAPRGVPRSERGVETLSASVTSGALNPWTPTILNVGTEIVLPDPLAVMLVANPFELTPPNSVP